jgi:hypothetical protein
MLAFYLQELSFLLLLDVAFQVETTLEVWLPHFPAILVASTDNVPPPLMIWIRRYLARFPVETSVAMRVEFGDGFR